MFNREIIHAVEAMHNPNASLQDDCFLVFYNGCVKRAKTGYKGPLITGIHAVRHAPPIPKSALPMELEEDGDSFILVSKRADATAAAKLIHGEFRPWRPSGGYR